MKNFILLAITFSLFSCTHQDQKIKFDLNFNTQQHLMEKEKINLVVLDDRMEKTIGTKEFSIDDKITISSSENLAELLQKKVSQSLWDIGFKRGADKTIEIHITKLQYRAKREFFVGESSAQAELKVIIKNNRKGSTFTKVFTSSLDSKHFLQPLESTDFETINNLLQGLVQNILDDTEVMGKLSQ